MIVSAESKLGAVNAGGTEHLGWTEDELVGANLADYIHPEDLVATGANQFDMALVNIVVNARDAMLGDRGD